MRINNRLEFYGRLFDLRRKLLNIKGYARIDPIYTARLCAPILSGRKG